MTGSTVPSWQFDVSDGDLHAIASEQARRWQAVRLEHPGAAVGDPYTYDQIRAMWADWSRTAVGRVLFFHFFNLDVDRLWADLSNLHNAELGGAANSVVASAAADAAPASGTDESERTHRWREQQRAEADRYAERAQRIHMEQLEQQGRRIREEHEREQRQRLIDQQRRAADEAERLRRAIERRG